MYKYHRFFNLLIFLFIFMFLCGCSLKYADGIKPFSEMTPKERATWMLSIYNSQAEDYKAMVVRPGLTNDQKQILRKKKSTMEKVWPMIKVYTTYVDSGAMPTKEMEREIMDLINEMTSYVISRISSMVGPGILQGVPPRMLMEGGTV